MSACGKCCSKSASTPGVWPTSPILTVCQLERSRIWGRRRSCAGSALAKLDVLIFNTALA